MVFDWFQRRTEAAPTPEPEATPEPTPLPVGPEPTAEPVSEETPMEQPSEVPQVKEDDALVWAREAYARLKQQQTCS